MDVTLRRSARIKSQTLKAEQRAAQAAQAAKAANVSKPAKPAPKRAQRKGPKVMAHLKYTPTISPLPTFEPLKVYDHEIFWLKVNLREFLIRFDKLCRLPTRFLSDVNDLLSPWTLELFKVVIMGMLKVINIDKKPIISTTAQTIAELEKLPADSPQIWETLTNYVYVLDKFTPESQSNEKQRLDLVRRLMVLTLSSEAVRITIQTDAEQLKALEKESAEEVKAIQAKLKETEQKLLALKKVDKNVYAERLANVQRAANNKVFKVHQQQFQRTHKYKMRSAPIAHDENGNVFWSLQYKSPTQPAWGNAVLCFINYRFDLEQAWYADLKENVQHVLTERDRLITEKNEERKRKRQAKTETAESSGTQEEGDKQQATKRKYPKLKIDRPKFICKPGYFLVEGKDEILELAAWLDSQPDITLESRTDLESVANYLAS